MKEICDKRYCTGCGACRDVCPKIAISFQPNIMGVLYPVIDESKCIDCGLCIKHCPSNDSSLYNKTSQVFAGWSNDSEIRNNSASGGIASEIYKYCLNHNISSYGVEWDKDFGCQFVKIEKQSDISRVSNSKYVYVNTNGIFKIIKEEIEHGHDVLFIGLPCQVAGLKKMCKSGCDKLYTVDLICHGVAPELYLLQHVKNLEQKYNRRCETLAFRDPEYGTQTYHFTLRSNKVEKPFYKKRVNEDDVYQLGFHRSLIYRENCYYCKYAQRERVGDLTIGDFYGVGSISSFPFPKDSISCILQNTTKGEYLLRELSKKAITTIERDPKEAYDFEGQLNHSSKAHPNRSLFCSLFSTNGDFDKSATICLKKEIRKNSIISKLHIYELKSLVKYIINHYFKSLK